MKKSLLYGLGLGIGLAAGAAFAAEGVTFQSLDKNQDGYIDNTEAGMVPALVEQFDQLDRNVDGKLSVEEFAAISTSKPAPES